MDLSWVLQLLIAPGFLLGVAVLIYSARPKAGRGKLIFSYIDADICQRVEQKEFEISWGRLPFRKKLRLAEVPADSYFEVTYTSLNRSEDHIPGGCLSVKPGREGKILYLSQRGFIKQTKIDCVRLLVKHRVDDSYKDKINHGISSGFLEILNHNAEEIRNFKLQISRELSLIGIVNAAEDLDIIRIEIPVIQLGTVLKTEIGKCQEMALPVSVLVRSIPAKRGDRPGKLSVRLAQRGKSWRASIR